MSRRRGWEDAYLDYASLRLLLTKSRQSTKKKTGNAAEAPTIVIL
jgi:hypothetical protein